MTDDVEAAIQTWFRDLQACVRAVDYERGRTIFAPQVVGFGTHGAVLEGLDALVAGQWQHVWPTIEDFTFNLDTLRWGTAGELAWAICGWDSLGHRSDGTTFQRPGRATVILGRDGSRWLAHHTHFSLAPTQGRPSP